MSQPVSQPETSAYKSLLYWRKSTWNDSRCVPVILMLEHDILAMRDNKEQIIFEVDITKVKQSFTKWGTMMLEVGDKKYDMVGMPAKTSPAITDSQKAELSGLGSSSQGKDIIDSKPVAISNAASDGVGGTAQTITKAATSTIAYYRGLATISEWKTLIGSRADQEMKMNAMTYYIIGIAILLLTLAVIGA